VVVTVLGLETWEEDRTRDTGGGAGDHEWGVHADCWVGGRRCSVGGVRLLCVDRLRGWICVWMRESGDSGEGDSGLLLSRRMVAGVCAGAVRMDPCNMHNLQSCAPACLLNLP